MAEILGFASEAAAENTPEALALSSKSDYAQVFEALKYDLGVAVTVFTRCAKLHLRELVTDGQTGFLTEEAIAKAVSENKRIWVSAISLTASINPVASSEVTSAQAMELSELVKNIHHAFRNDQHKVLLAALDASIKQVGTYAFTFTVKQKWCNE